MTVREDIEERIERALFQKLDMFAFYLSNAKDRMTKKELDQEIEENGGWIKEDVDIFKIEYNM